MVTREWPTKFVPATLYLVIVVAIGYGIPRASGLDRKTSSTIAVGATLKNILLSMFIATNTLNAIEAAYASALVGMLKGSRHESDK
jgi:bile acid:Na+ symporter, BASS family